MKAKEIAEYAYNHVPYYMRIKDNLIQIEKWEDMPVLTKEDIQNDKDSFFSCEFMNVKHDKDIMYSKTSGSTGRFLEFYWHINDYNKSLMPVWIMRKKYYGINPDDKMCYFFTSPNIESTDSNADIQVERIKNVLGFSKINITQDNLSDVYEEILRFEPVWFFMQPSMAVLLCDVAEKSGKVPDSLKYIELTGEMLFDSVRERIKRVFGCTVANHYGSNEVNTIAFECPCGNMHVADKNVKVEIVDEAGMVLPYNSEGRIILTSLHNRVSPFIRYDIGDIGILACGENCNCGNKGDVLSLTGGRKHEYVELNNGEKINAYIFVHAVEQINKEMDSCIKQFKINQVGYDAFRVKMVIDEEIYDLGISKEMIEGKFKEYITHPGMSNATYEFEFCDCIMQDSRGKMLWFEQYYI